MKVRFDWFFYANLEKGNHFYSSFLKEFYCIKAQKGNESDSL